MAFEYECKADDVQRKRQVRYEHAKEQMYHSAPYTVCLPQGPKGEDGEVGPIGPQGPKGEDGEVGPIGPQGPKGDTGERGPQGEKGEQGQKGDKGDKGDRGDKGAKGERGDKGETGDKGARGDKGDQGDQGVKGDKGDRGDKGDKGDRGAKGDKGDQGPRGPKGDKGENGVDGVSYINQALTPLSGSGEIHDPLKINLYSKHFETRNGQLVLAEVLLDRIFELEVQLAKLQGKPAPVKPVYEKEKECGECSADAPKPSNEEKPATPATPVAEEEPITVNPSDEF